MRKGAKVRVDAGKVSLRNRTEDPAWARRLAEAIGEDDFEEPPEVKAEPDHSHQGVHQPLKASGEGGFSTQSQWMEPCVLPDGAAASGAADPCRMVMPSPETLRRSPAAAELQGGVSLLSSHRASRRSGSVSQMRQGQGVLKVDSQALRQGIVWSEILNRRGGRRSIH